MADVNVATVMNKINALQQAADTANAVVEEMKAKQALLETKNDHQEHEIKSLTARNKTLEADVEKLEAIVQDTKGAASTDNQLAELESRTRKIALLEEEADKDGKTLREISEKLSETSLQAEQYARKVQALEMQLQENDAKDQKLPIHSEKLSLQLEEYERKVEALTKQLEIEYAKNEGLQETINKSENEKLNQTITNDKDNEVEKLKEQLEEEGAKYKKLEQEYETIQANLEKLNQLLG